MDNLNIPIYLSPEDVTNNNGSFDEKSLITQLATMKIFFDSHKNSEKEKIPPSSSSSVDDEIDEVIKAKENAEAEVDRLKKELDKLKDNLEKATKEIQSLQQEKEEANSKINTIAVEFEDLKEKISETEAILQHQKNSYDFEIDKLNEELSNLKDDLRQFKEANEHYALKVEKLHRDLSVALSERQECEDKEKEAIRIAEGLSKSLKELEIESNIRHIIETQAINKVISIKD